MKSHALTHESHTVGYGVTILSVCAAALAVTLMQAHWGMSTPVALFLVAVTVSVRFGGMRPGLLAVALSTLGFAAMLLMQFGPALVAHGLIVVRLVTFAAMSGYVLRVASTERRTNAALHRVHEELGNIKEQVCESDRRLQLVLDALPVGVAITDQRGDVVLANPSWETIWGGRFVSGEDRWIRLAAYCRDNGRPMTPADWGTRRAVFEGLSTLNRKIDLDRGDGRPKTIQHSAAPIRNKIGAIVGALVIDQDVTERARAESELQHFSERLRHVSRRLLRLQEEERQHLARELHDEFGQILSAVTLHLHAAKRYAGTAAQASLDRCLQLAQRAGEQVRSLTLELRPSMLETVGVEPALRWLAEQHEHHTGVVTRVFGSLEAASPEAGIACFRVVQEALTNVVRHAGARHVLLALRQSDGLIRIAICDDGIGFDVERALEQAAAGGSLGLFGMRERAGILGGSLEIDSQPGGGTTIRLTLPTSSGRVIDGSTA